MGSSGSAALCAIAFALINVPAAVIAFVVLAVVLEALTLWAAGSS